MTARKGHQSRREKALAGLRKYFRETSPAVLLNDATGGNHGVDVASLGFDAETERHEERFNAAILRLGAFADRPALSDGAREELRKIGSELDDAFIEVTRTATESTFDAAAEIFLGGRLDRLFPGLAEHRKR
jgi:hypothetical protein